MTLGNISMFSKYVQHIFQVETHFSIWLNIFYLFKRTTAIKHLQREKLARPSASPTAEALQLVSHPAVGYNGEISSSCSSVEICWKLELEFAAVENWLGCVEEREPPSLTVLKLWGLGLSDHEMRDSLERQLIFDLSKLFLTWWSIKKTNGCSRCDITCWFYTVHFEASLLVFCLQPSWLFGTRIYRISLLITIHMLNNRAIK